MINRETIMKLEDLCKLEFSEEEQEVFIEEFTKIIELVEQLQTLDTENIEPTYHGNNNRNVYRDDIPRVNQNYKELLDNAPSVVDHYIQVPAILETEEY